MGFGDVDIEVDLAGPRLIDEVPRRGGERLVERIGGALSGGGITPLHALGADDVLALVLEFSPDDVDSRGVGGVRVAVAREDLRTGQTLLAAFDLGLIREIARFDEQAVVDDRFLGVGMLPFDADVDAADAHRLVLADAVFHVDPTGLLKEHGLGIDHGEDASQLAVLVGDLFDVGVEFALGEVLVFLELHVLGEGLGVDHLVPFEVNVADLVAGPFLDVILDGDVGLVGRELFPVLDLHVEVAEARVVFLDGVDVFGDGGGVVLAAEQPQFAGAGLELGPQLGVGEVLVPLEADAGDVDLRSFLDEEHDFAVFLVIPFFEGDFGEHEAFFLVIALDAAGRLAVEGDIVRTAGPHPRQVRQVLRFELLVPLVFDRLEDGALDDLEDEDQSLVGLAIPGFDAEEPLGAIERADIFLDDLGVRRAARATFDFSGDLVLRDRLVPFDDDVEQRFETVFQFLESGFVLLGNRLGGSNAAGSTGTRRARSRLSGLAEQRDGVPRSDGKRQDQPESEPPAAADPSATRGPMPLPRRIDAARRGSGGGELVAARRARIRGAGRDTVHETVPGRSGWKRGEDIGGWTWRGQVRPSRGEDRHNGRDKSIPPGKAGVFGPIA